MPASAWHTGATAPICASHSTPPFLSSAVVFPSKTCSTSPHSNFRRHIDAAFASHRRQQRQIDARNATESRHKVACRGTRCRPATAPRRPISLWLRSATPSPDRRGRPQRSQVASASRLAASGWRGRHTPITRHGAVPRPPRQRQSRGPAWPDRTDPAHQCPISYATGGPAAS